MIIGSRVEDRRRGAGHWNGSIPWNELFPTEQALIVQLLVERIDVGTTGVDIRLRTEGPYDLFGADNHGHGERDFRTFEVVGFEDRIPRTHFYSDRSDT